MSGFRGVQVPTGNYTVGPPFTIAKLVNITPITMVYDTQMTIVIGVISQFIFDGAYIVEISPFQD